MSLQIVKTNRNVLLPHAATSGSAGLDCYSTRAVFLRPGETQMVGLGFKMALPPGTWGLLKERSSMGCQGVFVLGGVIDADYRGEVRVLLHNIGKQMWVLDIHQKICQLIVIPLKSVTIEECTTLTSTARGDGGFGSTGK